jgi:hypothetical protein
MQGASDKCIMQPKYLARLTRQQQWDVNLVRLYLQVITLSDMSEAKGQCIKECYLRGVRDNIQKHARKNWPRQATPTKHQINTWTTYIRTHFIRHGTKWRQALGPTKANTWEEYMSYALSKQFV